VSDGRQRARTYTSAGLRVIPVSPETKRPRTKGFDSPTFTAYQRVKPDDMVAVLCGPCPALGATSAAPLAGDWLLCIDLDGDLTPTGLADALSAELPETLTTHAGKHLWYRVEPGPHRDRLKQWAGILGRRKAWAGEGKAPDADVRWLGGYAREHKEPAEAFNVDQIVILPAATVEAIVATRPVSEEREAEALGPVHDLSDDAVELLVTALVPAWPDEGEGRHDAFLALGGMLRRQGVSARTTRAVATAIIDGTGSDRSRVKDALDAWTRTDAGQPAYGWTELSSHLHGDAETLLRAIDDATTDPWLTRLLAQGWPPPRPRMSVAEASPVGPSADEATAEAALATLPDWVSAHVRAAQEELRTPLDLNLINAIGVLACAASGRLKLRLTSTYSCHTCLFVCSVADPGQLKSPAFRLAAAPIKAWVAEQQDAERDALEQRRMKRDKLEADVKRLAKAWADGYDDDPAAPEAKELREKRVLLEVTQPPVPLEFLVQDATPEALSDLLATHGRIACLSSDASKIFSILGGQYSKGQADLGVWLEAYDGEMKAVHRIGREPVKPQHAQTTLSAVLSIQPEVLERITGNAAMVGEGLVQRFCWVVCQSSGPRWAPGEQPTPVPTDVSETWDAGVRFVLGLSLGTEVALSDGAREVYTAWRDELEERMQANGRLAGDMRGWASKHLERTARIAALLWACEGAEGKALGAEHMARAVTIGRWLVPHALRALHGGDATTDESSVLSAVARRAEQTGDARAWITRRELQMCVTPKRLRRNVDRVLVPILKDLVGRGALEATEDMGKLRVPK
jgi:hypothetical protein